MASAEILTGNELQQEITQRRATGDMSPLRLGVLLSGSGTNLQAILDRIDAGSLDAEVVLVVASRPSAYGLKRAEAHGIQTLTLSKEIYADPIAADEVIASELVRHKVDYVIMAGYMRMVHAPLLVTFPNRVVNLHPALLPSFPGAHAIADAFAHGVRVTGATVHFANASYDEGPIIAQKTVEVKNGWTLEDLEGAIHDVEHVLYPDVIHLLAEGRVQVRPDNTVEIAQEETTPKQFGARHVFYHIGLFLLVVVLASAIALGVRQAQRTLGAADSAPSPELSGGASAISSANTDSFSTELTYTSLDVVGNGEVSSTVTWRDSWFSSDSTVYNHELAHTASVLSALAYSESTYYQSPSTHPAYMEQALSKLGFSDVSTESYRYRSEVIDEILNVVTNESDVAAYTIARRHLTDSDGKKRDLIMVSARGSYGSEWLSNLNLQKHESENHSGYLRAAQDICKEIKTWSANSKAAGAAISVLLVGHSRGGSIANLVAAELLEANTDSVYAYTFASPATTLSSDARSERYASIFNVINPSDLMPSLPLKAWGYKRYGTDLVLPGVGDEGFKDFDQKMRESYKASTGVECSYDPADRNVVQAVIDEVGSRISSVDELLTPQGAAAVFVAVTSHVDPIRILYSHYPSTYIAWLAVTGSGNLVQAG